MITVYKYPLTLNGLTEMPFGSEIIFFGEDATHALCVWAIVDTQVENTESRDLIVCGTGQPLPESYVYIQSCQQLPYIWHLFERYP